jgi:hypothetical protein
MRRKPVLTDNHRASRILWCTSHQADNFDQDIFIGKTALKPFLASLNQLKGTPVDPNMPKQQTTLHLWGAISRKGASPLQVNHIIINQQDVRFAVSNPLLFDSLTDI